MMMAAIGNFNALRALIDSNKVDVNTKDLEGISALHYCVIGSAKLNNPNQTCMIIDYLVDHGANVNALDCNHTSPLYQAIALGQTACMDKLLEKGAHPIPPINHEETSTKLLIADPNYMGKIEDPPNQHLTLRGR